MTLFEALFVTHFVADWIFQSQWEANNKSKNIWALLHHCSIYVLFFIPALAYFHQLRYSILILLFVSHAILDNRRFEFWIMKLKGIKLSKEDRHATGIHPYSHDFVTGQHQPMDLGLWWIIMIGIDQTLHLFILGVIAFLVTYA